MESTYHSFSISNGDGIKKLDPRFYDQPCYEFEEQGDLLLSGSMNITYSWVNETINDTTEIKFTAGEKYYVVFDKKVYKLEASTYLADGIAVLGSMWQDGTAIIDNGTPFGFITGMFSDVMITHETPGTHTFEIYSTKVATVPLPEKFMPELTQVILVSPSGKKFKTTVGDDGVLTTTEV